MNMLRTLCITLAASAGLASLTHAQLPVRSGEGNLFGLSYDFGWRGEAITDSKVNAHLMSHRATYAWAPWEYLEMSVGAGATQYSTYQMKGGDFDGNWQFSPSAGLLLNTPAVAGIFRLRAAVDYCWWQSEEAGITYSEHVIDPAGSLVWNTRLMDLEIGLVYHMGLGTMETAAKESDFSNYYSSRAFGALLIKLPAHTFMRLYGDASPKAKGWHGGPTESTLGVSFGWLMHKSKASNDEPELRHFPSVPGMREKQEQMSEELKDEN